MTTPTLTMPVSPMLRLEVYQHIRASHPPDALVPWPDMSAVPVVVAMDRWTPKTHHVSLRLWPSSLGTWLLWRREVRPPASIGDGIDIRTIPLYETDGTTLTRIAYEWLYDRPRPAR